MSDYCFYNPGKEPDKLENPKIRRSPNMSDKPLWNLVKGLNKSDQ
jgi:hypothetical protein